MIALFLTLALGIDLDTARLRATEQAIDVARAQEMSQVARGQTWIAVSGALPSIDLFASASTGSGLTTAGFQRPVRTTSAMGVTGRWTLIDPASWAGGVAARHSAQGRASLEDWARVTARRDATVAVADLWAAQEVLQAWDASADDAEQASQAVRSLVEAGLRPRSDAARTRATAATLRARAAEAHGVVAGRCAALQALMRDPVDGQCALDTPHVAPPRDGAGAHPAIAAAEQALHAARAARAQALLDRVPMVAVTGTAAQYTAGDSKGFGWNTGVEARLPVLSGGAGLGANTVARAQRDDAELALEGQTLQLAAARISAQARWQAAVRGLEALEVAERAAEEALLLIDARYGEGLEDLEGWLLARRDRDEARVALAQGRAEQLRALAELESVRGVW